MYLDKLRFISMSRKYQARFDRKYQVRLLRHGQKNNSRSMLIFALTVPGHFWSTGTFPHLFQMFTRSGSQKHTYKKPQY